MLNYPKDPWGCTHFLPLLQVALEPLLLCPWGWLVGVGGPRHLYRRRGPWPFGVAFSCVSPLGGRDLDRPRCSGCGAGLCCCGPCSALDWPRKNLALGGFSLSLILLYICARSAGSNIWRASGVRSGRSAQAAHRTLSARNFSVRTSVSNPTARATSCWPAMIEAIISLMASSIRTSCPSTRLWDGLRTSLGNLRGHGTEDSFPLRAFQSASVYSAGRAC